MSECERTTTSKPALGKRWFYLQGPPPPTPARSHGPGDASDQADQALEPPDQTNTKQPAGFLRQPGRTENQAGPRPFRTGSGPGLVGWYLWLTTEPNQNPSFWLMVLIRV